MEEFSIQDLEEIIQSGDFGSLKEKIENDFFDCKIQPYHLQNGYSKQELAKDVSSFANLNGGYILIGPKTPQNEEEKSKTHLGNEVIEISLLDRDLVDPDQYKKVIKSWIHPEIKGFDVYWVASKDDRDKGVVVIEIPSQVESLKPFLIIKTVFEDGKKSEKIFGYAERKGDCSDPKKIKDIHRVMRDGLFYDKNIKNRFDNLESIIQSLSEERQEEGQKDKNKNLIDERINENLQSYDEQQ